MNPRLLRAGLAVGAVLTLTLAGCATDDGGTGEGGDGKQSGRIALLLPESKTTRYEAADRPYFEAKVAKLCPDCEIVYSNADQDSGKQQTQAEAALTRDVDVMVLDPVDGKAAAAIVNKAKQQDVPVISYDRLTQGPIDYYISFDNERVGQLQGESLLEALGDKAEDGKTVMINGDPTDNNATLFKKGAHSALDGKVEVGKEYDTPQWSPDNAQRQMEQAITALGKDRIVGVYAANDGTAGGAIAAMKSAGISPLPPVTGQDAELAGIQRIVAGEQYMTVYKEIKLEAETAAEMAVAILRGEQVQGADSKVANDTKEVPSVLLEPIAVTQDNLEETVIADEFHKVSDICTDNYAAACKKLGIS